MAKLLHIVGSPRGDRSYSLRAAREFVGAYRAAHPDDEVETWDLWTDPPPAFDLGAVVGKYRILHGEEHTAEEAEAWQAVVETIERFKGADKLLISSPMWNFAIPYPLKQLLDVIVQPTYTFSFSPETGYSGLIADKPALLVVARGGEYRGDTAAYDQQVPYLKQILGFVGITDVKVVAVEPTLEGGREVATQKLETAAEELRRLAATF